MSVNIYKKSVLNFFFVVLVLLLTLPATAADKLKLKGLELKDENFMFTVTSSGYFKIIMRQNTKMLTYPGEHGARGARIVETYDLENDPEEKINLSSYHQDLTGDGLEGGRIKVLESSRTRVILQVKGSLGYKEEEKVKVTKKYVIYPTGQIYIKNYFEGMPNVYYVGPYANGMLAFVPADSFNDPGGEDPDFWVSWGGQKKLSDAKSSFILFRGTSEHPEYFKPTIKTHKEDMKIGDVKAVILMVLHYQESKAYYWGRWAHNTKAFGKVAGKPSCNVGDINFAFDCYGKIEYDLKDSKTLTCLLQIKPGTIDSNKAAKPYAKDYRTPGPLFVLKGSPVKDDADDLNHDGYNEAEGCYQIKATGDEVSFNLDCKVKRFNPIFKIVNWSSAVPASIEVNGEKLR
ncbi:MAG: hypothetical protein WCI43_09585, partial [Candidatus Firestonebacteria bacterium]